MLLVAPYARWPVTLAAERLGAAAYVALTAALMRAFGAGPSKPAGPAAWRVEAARPYRATDLRVEYDASAAAHLFALAAATGGQVTVTNAHPRHPAARRRPAGPAGGDGGHAWPATAPA